MSSLHGKLGVVMGVANKNSIAWGITQALRAAGARLAFNYPNEKMESRVRQLTEEIPDAVVLPCDLTRDEQVAEFFAGVGEAFGGRLDFLIHSVAFANREDLEGRFVDTQRAGFATALDVSAYSLVAATRAALPLLEAAGGGSVLTMSYYGAEKVVPQYNVMGVAKAALEASVRYLAADLGPQAIRVNAISAGAVNTLSARGIKGFTGMLREAADKAPLRRNITLEEIGATAVFLVSPGSAGITGEIMHVDAGYNILGV